MPVEGLEKVLDSLRRKIAQAVPMGKTRLNILIGYTASYSLRIHEDLQMPHTNGQAKFLEQPARQKSREIMDRVKKALLARKTLANALLDGGQYLLKESQNLVPVRTGNLRNSGYVRLSQE